MSDKDEVSDELADEIEKVLTNAQTGIEFEELLKLLMRFGVTANGFREFMATQTKFSQQWVDEACMILFQRFFGA